MNTSSMFNTKDLHVVVAYSNPMNWKSRLRLYEKFREEMLLSGVSLTVVECVYGDHQHILSCGEVNHIPVRASSLVWNKENLQNIGVSRLPLDWKYVCFLDADVHFRDENWVQILLHQLQHYPVVQPWRECLDLGPKGEIMQIHKSFGRNWVTSPSTATKGNDANTVQPYPFSHPGYGMAFTRQGLNSLGGLLEVAALGAGDHHMALSFAGKAIQTIPKALHVNYQTQVYQWEMRALREIKGAVGYIPVDIEHGFHGSKKKRAYIDRWGILIRNSFDPLTDVMKNVYGVVELSGGKPQLGRDIMEYFSQRDEDENST